MKILFIGGTGRLSKDVASLAYKQGNEVFLLTRGTLGRKKFVQNGYHMLYGNIRDRESCKKILDGKYFDVIIDFLTFDISQLENTLDIIENHYMQYIFISTATVYKKKDENEIISEYSTDIGNGKWEYALKKYRCEVHLKKYFSGKPNTHYTIIRPYVTYGNTRVPYPIVPMDTTKEWSFLDRIIHDQPIPVFDNGKTITTLTHTRDFAKGVVGLFGNPKAYEEAFHITNGENSTWEQVLCAIEHALKKNIVYLNVSQKEICDILPEYCGILEGDKGTNMRFSNSKIVSVVPEFVCEVSLEAGIEEMVKFYLEHHDMQIIDYHWQGEMDKLCLKKGLSIDRKYIFSSFKERFDYYSGRHNWIDCLVRNMKRLKKRLED